MNPPLMPKRRLSCNLLNLNALSLNLILLRAECNLPCRAWGNPTCGTVNGQYGPVIVR
jgi:hypothetical protein